VGTAQLRVLAGPDRGIVLDLPLGSRVVIGCGEAVDLRLNDADVSSRHCALEHRLAGVFVEDLQSSTGTILDGKRINGRCQLAADSASLDLGGSRLQIFRSRPQAPFPEIPGLTIVRRLGAGASGVVYEAVIQATREAVAVKILAADADDVSRQRFEREATLRDRLDHPGIARIIKLTRLGGRPCLIRELVPGVSLEEQVDNDGSMHWPQAFSIGITIAQALAHAHGRGVVHRDVKPANIIIDRNYRGPKLIDFDLAKRMPESTQGTLTRLTQTGEGLGSLSYLAPEQLTAARDVGAVADIYGLGMTLYHLVTGQRPFLDVEPEDYISALTETGPRSLAELAPNTPEHARKVLERAYDPDPAKRYADARTFAMCLSQAVAGPPQ
jgi:serine/threonine protein kinase